MDEQAWAGEGSTMSPENWGDIASVRRTIEWLAVDEKRIEAARYGGATCVKLLDRVLGREGMHEDLQGNLQTVRDSLSTFDECDLEQRKKILETVRLALEPIIRVSELGARRHDLDRKSKLSAPNRPDRKERKAKNTSRKSEASPEAASDGEQAAAGAEETETQKEEAGSAESTEATQDKPRERKPRSGSEHQRNLPRLALDHEEGTGRSISTLSHATEDVVAALEAKGIQTITHLLATPPVEHTRVQPLRLSEEEEGEKTDEAGLVRGKLVTRCVRFTGEAARWEVVLEDRKVGPIRCRWVTAVPRGWSQWRTGMELAMAGSPEQTDDGWVLYEGEPIGIDGRGSGWLPTYGIEGIEDRVLRDLVSEAIVDMLGRLREPLPRSVVDQYRLTGLDEALRDAHFPANMSGRGRHRLAFEELLMLQAGIGWRARARSRGRGLSHNVLHRTIGDLGAQQRVYLSDSQEVAFSEIRRDLSSNQPMVRLLQGEVGTDKHSIAMLASTIVVENKSQVAFILPDAASAERRYLFSESVLRGVGVAPLLISGVPDRGQLDAIGRGESHIVFGTMDLLEASPEWKKLGLVIVEERDAYGTVDPARLVANGIAPDLLVITDTPIPTSLTLTLFGEYQMSMVHQAGPVRATSELFPVSDRADAYSRARELVEAGRQAYVVFPVGEDGDLLEPKDALRFAEALQSEAFPEARIGVYCSAMSRDERLRVFEDFQHRRIDVLVATTYIEDAPPVPNATVMVVEHADRHDLVRLHRLRGHVGQGTDPGRLVLVMSDSPAATDEARLQQVIDVRDGFRIAEMDLAERGHGAVLGNRADEAPVFQWADPVTDRDLLLRAREESFRLVRQDPRMRRWGDFSQAIHRRWGSWLGEDFPKAEAIKSGKSGKSGGGSRRRRRRRRR